MCKSRIRDTPCSHTTHCFSLGRSGLDGNVERGMAGSAARKPARAYGLQRLERQLIVHCPMVRGMRSDSNLHDEPADRSEMHC